MSLAVETDVALSAYYNDLPSFLRLPNSSRQLALPHVYTLQCVSSDS